MLRLNKPPPIGQKLRTTPGRIGEAIEKLRFFLIRRFCLNSSLHQAHPRHCRDSLLFECLPDRIPLSSAERWDRDLSQTLHPYEPWTASAPEETPRQET